MDLRKELWLFLAISTSLIHTVLGDDPIVTIPNSTPDVDPVDGYIKCPKDEDAFLICAVTNKPIDSDVKWVMQAVGDSVLTPISTDLNSEDPFKYSLEKPSPTAWRLKVQNVQVTDEGRYTCRVQTGSQIYVQAVADIKVTEVPRISDLSTSSDTTVKEGDKVMLRCNATGRPFPTVAWSRMAGELLPTGGQELQDNILNIPSAKAEHAGIYKCTAKNFAGQDNRNIYLQVKFKPRVTVESPRVGQAPGYYKSLICIVKGYPVPTTEQVSWSHSVSPIYSAGRFEITNIPGAYNRITSILTIKGVQPSDYGNFRCAATNEQGDGEAAIELYASDQPTPDRTGQINSRSSALVISATTLLMLLSTCLLHRLNL
ncbi:protein amalgam-like [Haliotis rufescens]|uniref:protein amalgam-like n=1 Tax=Haliotis rufescens TaxID=6454 RepID=UPI001EAFB2B0|nr:protein amalgam-like [Haliotis rufescens]